MWPLSSDEIYVSIDIEADGRIPGLHSMLSLGAAALTSEGRLVDTFSVNLEQLPDATAAVPGMRWWAAHSEAWEASRTNTQAPEPAMRRFHAWLEAMHSAVGWPVMVGYPVAFDAMWVQWYLHRFAGEDPFRRRAIDIKTLAMVAMGAGYRPTMKSHLPKHWLPRAAHTHRDLESMMTERSVAVDHSTIYRWVQRYAPEMEKRLRWQWRCPRSSSWRVDETYVKVRGKWAYLWTRANVLTIDTGVHVAAYGHLTIAEVQTGDARLHRFRRVDRREAQTQMRSD